jgi:hypothetical protein
MQTHSFDFTMKNYQKCHLFIFSSNENGIRFLKKIDWTPRKDIGVVSKEI